jgi:hypothetical protein
VEVKKLKGEKVVAFRRTQRIMK